jgi:DNA polymerase-3 subunit alpha
MQEFLEETYGITVYQEQVMRLSQKLAGFTKGEADVLRKAMGKKDAALLAKLKPKFLEGGKEREHPETVLDKVWKDWEAFASYAFNKSHSTCYAWIAYQTAYLKANYPAEYMAAVLTNNMDDIKQVTFFMEEARRMRIPVLGPDVNESILPFAVNAHGAIRFGLGGMRGVGEGAVDHLVKIRTEGGPFLTLFDLVKRVDLRTINKGTMEALAGGGALDGLAGTHRGHFFFEEDGKPYLEKVRRYGQNFQDDAGSSQASLFGEASNAVLEEPAVPDVPQPNPLLVLKREKEINGVYISAHPLDQYRYEMKHFVKNQAEELKQLDVFVNGSGFRDFTVAGMVQQSVSRMTKSNREMGSFVLEDKEGAVEMVLFGEDYLKFKHLLANDQLLLIRGRVQKPSWGGKDGAPERYMIQILEIKLLADVLRSAQKLEVTLDLEHMTPAAVERMQQAFAAHPGDKRVSFAIREGEQGIKIIGKSRNTRVQLEQPLLLELESIVGEQALKLSSG